jgi:L-fuculose-phosphate aldolase
MSTALQDYRQAIVEVGKLVYQKDWVAANDGNISIRLGENRILCTPTGVCKGRMHPDDMIVCDLHANKVEGRLEPTTEILVHTIVYKMRPDVGAVLHAHPPTATAYAAAGRALNLAVLPEVIVGLGCVPVAEYGLPGTPELPETLVPFIPKYDAILMANHGVVSYAANVWSAFFQMERVEHFARIAFMAEMLGGANVLPRAEVARLFDARTRYGVKSRAGGEPGCPVVAEDLESGGTAERFQLTRDELIALVDQAMRSRT